LPIQYPVRTERILHERRKTARTLLLALSGALKESSKLPLRALFISGKVAGRQRKETSDMESSAHHLMENLRHQVGLHHDLLSLFDKKRRAISERDVVGLEAVLFREEGIVTEIGRLKESTAAILEKFAQRLDVSPDDAIIDAIAASMQEDARKSFLQVLAELTRTAREIASHDALRARLVKEPVGTPTRRKEAVPQRSPRRTVRRARRKARTLSGQPA
jgi:hypothetical protein